MVEGGGMKCVKYLLFFFNMLFVIAGLALIIIGAIAVASLAKSSPPGASYYAGGVIILVVGAIIFIVAFLGCCGAIKENYCMLMTFGVLMILILILSVVALIVAFAYRSKVEGKLRELLYNDIRNYKKVPTSTEFWDTWQRNDHCCGMNSSLDWSSNPTLNQNQSVPDSCCSGTSQPKDCGKGCLAYKVKCNLYNVGCFTDKYINNVKYALLITGGIAAAVAILMLIGICLAFGLAHAIRKDYKVV